MEPAQALRREIQLGLVTAILSTEGGKFTITLTNAATGAQIGQVLVVEDEVRRREVMGKLKGLQAKAATPPPPIPEPNEPEPQPSEEGEDEGAEERPGAPASERPRVALGADAACQLADKIVDKIDFAARGKSDLWTNHQREMANLCAMWTLYDRQRTGTELNDADRAHIALYSGWGGLSHRENLYRMPEGWEPEIEGLIHEYYTPSNIAADVVRVVKPWLADVPHDSSGRVLGLEPSCGIGRFLRAAEDGGLGVQWTAVEFSHVSYEFANALFPDAKVIHSSFEEWNAKGSGGLAGKLGLVLSNPPYSMVRGEFAGLDYDPDYKESRAYVYFMRRALDLLGEGGIGVFVVPAGFLSGPSEEGTREKVLTRAHLMAAFRIPDRVFPGAGLTLDVLFFKGRGGKLAKVNPSDAEILAGNYFKANKDHILGTEEGVYGEGSRYGKKGEVYHVIGTFTAFPAFTPRPMLTESALSPLNPAPVYIGSTEAMPEDPTGKDKYGAIAAHRLGLRVGEYFAALAANDSSRHVDMWPELTQDLADWHESYGNPRSPDAVYLQEMAQHNGPIGRFMLAWREDGVLVDSLREKPVWSAVYRGNANDLVALAGFLYRGEGTLSLDILAERVAKETGLPIAEAKPLVRRALPNLYEAGWRLTGIGMQELVPLETYLEGDLWPKHDEALAALQSPVVVRGGRVFGSLDVEAVEGQVKALLKKINPPTFDWLMEPKPEVPPKPGDPPIPPKINPNDGWIPWDVTLAWIRSEFSNSNRDSNNLKTVLSRANGMIMIAGIDYAEAKVGEMDNVLATGNVGVRWFIGWYNSSDRMFNPSVTKTEEALGITVEQKRAKEREKWRQSFWSWLRHEERSAQRDLIVNAYGRAFLGFVPYSVTQEPIAISQWTGPITLKPWQNAGARRILKNRMGLIAFDVGVGKTFTGIAAIAKAREEGWCRKPVIVVPNSIVWKWFRDINGVYMNVKDPRRGALPDYRVGVIGARMVQRTKRVPVMVTATKGRGKNKVSVKKIQNKEMLVWVSEPDDAEMRGAKWTEFQQGKYDVMLLTYSALGTTKMDQSSVEMFVDTLAGIKQSISKGKQKTKKTELEDAKLIVNVKEFVAEKLKPRMIPARVERGTGKILVPAHPMEYDRGPTWDEIGVDMIVVDEAQNYKNLFSTEKQWKYMNSPEEGSNRAWHLFFRCAAVRAKQRGAGVVLLSATPAKNSPLEFYSIYSYLDPNIWQKIGVNDPEAFVERFVAGSMVIASGGDGALVRQMAATGFYNKDELQRILFRYGEFKTAVDVGLELPKVQQNYVDDKGTSYRMEVHPEVDYCRDGIYSTFWFDASGKRVHVVNVGLAQNPTQRVKDAMYRARYEQLKKSNNPATRNAMLGLITRRNMISVHPALDETSTIVTRAVMQETKTLAPGDFKRNPVHFDPIVGELQALFPDVGLVMGGNASAPNGDMLAVRFQKRPNNAGEAWLNSNGFAFDVKSGEWLGESTMDRAETINQLKVALERVGSDGAVTLEEDVSRGYSLITTSASSGDAYQLDEGVAKFLDKPKDFGPAWTFANAGHLKEFNSPKLDACAKRVAKSLACGHAIICKEGDETNCANVLFEHLIPAEVVLVVDEESRAKDVLKLVSGRLGRPGDVQVVITTEEIYKLAGGASVTCQLHEWPEEKDKQAELADTIFGLRVCGHIIFCDYVAAHVWMKKVLMQYGVPEKRIGILNADATSSPGARLEVADKFNGNPAAHILPEYDVVIANAVAYEGIDLQTRTCAIHHLDLPWDPSTLHQRNGRGVRQGNAMSTIEVNYYLGRCSGDAMRFSMIHGKRGWIVAILEGQDLATNNPAAGSGLESSIGMVACEEKEADKAMNSVCSQLVHAERMAAKEAAFQMFDGANREFRNAERAEPADVEDHRRHAEELLSKGTFAEMIVKHWPYVVFAPVMRDVYFETLNTANQKTVEKASIAASDVVMTPPVWEGLRMKLFGTAGESYIHIGSQRRRATENGFGVRQIRKGVWAWSSTDELGDTLYAATKYYIGANKTDVKGHPWQEPCSLPLQAFNPADFPETEDDVRKDIERVIHAEENPSGYDKFNNSKAWERLGWCFADAAWLERYWPTYRTRILSLLQRPQRDSYSGDVTVDEEGPKYYSSNENRISYNAAWLPILNPDGSIGKIHRSKLGPSLAMPKPTRVEPVENLSAMDREVRGVLGPFEFKRAGNVNDNDGNGVYITFNKPVAGDGATYLSEHGFETKDGIYFRAPESEDAADFADDVRSALKGYKPKLQAPAEPDAVPLEQINIPAPTPATLWRFLIGLSRLNWTRATTKEWEDVVRFWWGARLHATVLGSYRRDLGNLAEMVTAMRRKGDASAEVGIKAVDAKLGTTLHAILFTPEIPTNANAEDAMFAQIPEKANMALALKTFNLESFRARSEAEKQQAQVMPEKDPTPSA